MLVQTRGNASRMRKRLYLLGIRSTQVDYDVLDVHVADHKELRRPWHALGGGPSYRPWELLVEVNGNVAEEEE